MTLDLEYDFQQKASLHDPQPHLESRIQFVYGKEPLGLQAPAACQKWALLAALLPLDMGGGQSWLATHFAETWV